MLSKTPTKNNTLIPLSIPHIAGNEWKYVKECLDTGWVSSVGSYVTLFEEKIVEYTGAKYAVACMNGTAALHLSLQLSGVEADDYVIAPNITFIATINSIKYTNANPILIDVDPETWQMDLNLLEQFLENETDIVNGNRIYKKDGKRIKAIMPVHVLGNMCDMDHLLQIAKKYELTIIEDSTEALGSTYKGKHSGTFGKFGTFSFNGNKIITTGGGGMIVTNDEELAKKAKHLTTQAKIHPQEYIHDQVGYNYRLVNVLAAIGVGQMELLPDFVKRKKEMDNFYQNGLKALEHIVFQKVLPEVDANQWLCTIRTTDRQALLDYLNENKIQSRPFWMPMNQLEMFKNDVYVQNDDRSNFIYQHCLSIPSSVNLSNEQLSIVVDNIKAFYA